jgi:hypothetical protein
MSDFLLWSLLYIVIPFICLIYLTSIIQIIYYIIYRDTHKSFNRYKLVDRYNSDDDDIDIELG